MCTASLAAPRTGSIAGVSSSRETEAAVRRASARYIKLTQTTFTDLFRQGFGFAFFTVGFAIGAIAVWARIQYTGDITPGIFFALLGTAAFIAALSAAFFMIDV